MCINFNGICFNGLKFQEMIYKTVQGMQHKFYVANLKSLKALICLKIY